MARPDIGLVVDKRIINPSSIVNFQCSPYAFPHTVDPNLVDRLVSEDMVLLYTFLLLPEAEIEGVVVDPWGDETAFYEAVLLNL